MKAMIFAAGLGTRLKPLTDTMPKALVPVKRLSDGLEKPLLWWTVQRLKAAGVDEVVINIHHFADKVEEYVRGEDNFGLKVEFSDERQTLLDTGGGLLNARGLLCGGTYHDDGGPFLLHNVDIISNLDLACFCRKPLGDALASLAVADRPSDRKLLFDGDMHLVGWKNTVTGELRGPASRAPSERYRELSFAGIHLVSPAIFRAFDEYSQFRGAFGIIDFYLEVCARYPIFGFLGNSFEFLDVGTPETLGHAGTFL